MRAFRLHQGKPGNGIIGDHNTSSLWFGETDETDREGLSCCASYEDLLTYFTGNQGEHSLCRATTLNNTYLIEIEGELSEDTPYEECDGEILLHPTAIISVEPASLNFLEDLCEEAASQWGCDAVRLAEDGEWESSDRCEECGELWCDDGTFCGPDEDEDE